MALGQEATDGDDAWMWKAGGADSVVADEGPPRRRANRRAVAVVAFAVAALSVLVLPGAIGRNTVGLPVAGSVPAAPQDGACRAPLTSAAQVVGYEDAVPVVPCSEPHSGEIVYVGSIASDLRPDDAAADASILIRIEDQCDDLARRFVAGVRDSHPLGRVDPRSRGRLTLPTQVQWAQGQRWWSCQVVPASGAMPSAWEGTARLAALKRPPATFANCADGVNGAPVDCALPHTAELLSWNDTPERGVTGCLEVVAAIMNVEDPTVGGKLEIVGRKTQAWTSCWVHSISGPLTDTVIDLGDAPLPLG